MIKKHLRKIVCKPFQELKGVLSKSSNRGSVRTKSRGRYDEKRFYILYSQIMEILNYENNNGTREERDSKKIIEKKYNISLNDSTAPYKLIRLGEDKREQADRYGFGPRLQYIVERFEEEHGTTTFGAGFGADQEKTEREFEERLGFQFCTDERPAHELYSRSMYKKKIIKEEKKDNIISYLMKFGNLTLKR